MEEELRENLSLGKGGAMAKLHYSSSSSSLHPPCVPPPSLIVFLLLINAVAFVSLHSPSFMITHLYDHRRPTATSTTTLNVSLAAIRDDNITFSLSVVEGLRQHDHHDYSTANFQLLGQTAGLSDDMTSRLVLPPPPPPRKKETHKRSRRVLNLVQQSPKSTHFAARAEAFFAKGCKSRFFLTWISPAPANFGSRESLAVESIFRYHPDACVLLLSHVMDSARGRRLLRPFFSLGLRIAAISPDYHHLFCNTPAEAWFDRLKQGGVDPGDVPLGQNLSNLLRLAVLYKYGGVYVDVDVIVLRSFVPLHNTIGAQAVDGRTGRWSRLNNAVMVFDREHPLLYKFMEDFVSTFNGNKWGHNGPYLVSRVMAREIPETANVTVLPPMGFYPVDWNSISGLFHGQAGSRDQHREWAAAKLGAIRRESFAIHMWNRQSKGLKVEDGSVIRTLMFDSCILCNFSPPTPSL